MSSVETVRLDERPDSTMMTAHHSYMDIVGCFFIVFIVLFGGTV